MADERWNKARAALINNPDFDALPVDEKRVALQHLKAKLTEPVTVSKEPDKGSLRLVDHGQVKDVPDPRIRKPLLPQRQELPQRPAVKPTLSPTQNAIGVGLEGSMIGSINRLAGHQSLMPEGGLRAPQGLYEQSVAGATQMATDALPTMLTGGPAALGAVGGGAAMSGVPSLLREAANVRAGANPIDALGSVVTDTATGAIGGKIAQAIPGNTWAPLIGRNLLQQGAGDALAYLGKGQAMDPSQSAGQFVLSTAIDALIPGNTPTAKSLFGESDPRIAQQSGSAFADDASFGGVFRKGDEPPTGGLPASDPNMPPPRPPGSPTAVGAAPDGPQTNLSEKLMDNAAAQALGETLPDLPRGAEGIPSDPNFQLANRNVDEPTQRVMAETAKAYGDHIQDRRRGVIPREQTKEQAALLGMTDKQLQSRLKGQAYNSEQLQAALDLTEQSATAAKRAADEMAAKREAGQLTDADRLAFLETVQNHALNQAEFSGATAEVARSLNVLRAAKNAKRKGEFIKKALDQFGGSEHIDDLIDVIAKTDPADLPRTMNKIQDPTFLEMLSTLRKAGLMSGFKTPAKNVLSTGGNVAVQQELSQAIAGTLDWAYAGVTGKDRTTYGASLPAMLRAGREALGKGGREAGQILRYGATPEQMLKAEATRELKLTRSPKVNAVINMPFRIAGAGDAIMKAYVNRRYLEGMARVAALNEAKAGKIGRDQVKARTRELVENPTPVMAAEAIAEADYQTFNEANLLADKITAFTQVGRNRPEGQLLNFAKDQVLPFLKVPINYYSSQILDMTGLRPLARMFYSDRAKSAAGAGSFRDAMKQISAPLSDADRKAIFKAVGMGAIGTAQIMLGQSLAKQGLATGTSFSDKGDKGRDDATGIPRGAVNLKAFGGPDKWVSSSWLFPLITMGASFQEAGSSTNDPVKQAARMAIAGGSVVLEQPFLKGMKDTVDALKSPATAGEHWLGSQAGSFVPSLLNDVAALGDNVKRQADTWTDSVKSRIPGLRQTLPPKTDPFGRPMEQQANFAFDPFQTKSDKTSDPIMAELSRLKVDITYPSDKLHPIAKDGEKVDMPLTADQQNAIRSKVGDVSMSAMQTLMSSQSYQGLSDDEKKDAIEHMLSTIKTRIKKAVTGQATEALQSAR